MSYEKPPTKADRAVDIFRRYMDQKDDMPPRVFRKMVVKVMAEELHLTSHGAEGLYFAHARRTALGLPQRNYNGKNRAIIKQRKRELKANWIVYQKIEEFKETLGDKIAPQDVTPPPAPTKTWDEVQAILRQRKEYNRNI